MNQEILKSILLLVGVIVSAGFITLALWITNTVLF
jgi:hypothetical protein